MAKYQQYAEYKDSGVEWLGKIPHGWKVLRGKYVFQEFRERSTTGEEVLLSVSEYYGVKPRSEKISEGDHLSRAESLVDYKKCYKNDLVMNIMLAWKRGLGVSKYDGIVSPAYSVFRFNEDIHPYFMHHLFRTDLYTSHFKTRSTGVIDSRLRLYPESFLDTEILIPSYKEQVQIANFLDHETAKIDTLIDKQQTLIKLLKEKRQAVISHAVTKGLNPDAPMKDSGVEWLGKVPEHWEFIKFDYVINAVGDIDHYMPSSTDSGIPYVMTGDLRDLVSEISFENCKQVAHSDYVKLSRKIKASKDDIIFARYATIGTLSYVDIDADFLVSYSCVIIKPNSERTSGKYLFRYLKSQAFLQAITMYINSNTQGNVGIDSLKNVKVIMPPLSEQEEIINFLNDVVVKIDRLLDKAKSAITLMQERRTALISAAVTGKIDVRGWRASE